MPLPVIAVTGGEPAGIGADICLDLAAAKLPCRPVVLADIGLLRQRAAQLGKTVALRDFSSNLPPQPGTLDVWHIPLAAPCEAGRLNAANSPYVLQLLDTAHQGIRNGTFAAMTTAPLHKGIINDAGAGGGFFSGHTEYLAEKSGTPRVVMMLAGGGLRVALATTHLPLKACWKPPASCTAIYGTNSALRTRASWLPASTRTRAKAAIWGMRKTTSSSPRWKRCAPPDWTSAGRIRPIRCFSRLC